MPNYDFNWQITYELAEPKSAAEGYQDRSRSRTYDNSPANKFNPDPTQAVNWGDQTWEEMMIGFFATVRDVPKGASATGAGAQQ